MFMSLNALVSIAQNDLDNFTKYAEGLASGLGEIGTLEIPAEEKLKNVLLLSLGDDLPILEDVQIL